MAFMDGYKPAKNTAPPAGIGQGRDGSLSAAAGGRIKINGKEIDGEKIVAKRHVDFTEHQMVWKRLLDSYESGDRFRNAVYGPDRKGLPCRNLFRHEREYPDPQNFPNLLSGYTNGNAAINAGSQLIGTGPYAGQVGADPAATAADDPYEYRRARTPPPDWIDSAVDTHLSKIYEQPVSRDGPPELLEWWQDCDGCGTPIADWMRETVAPLLEVLGCLDLVFDHPPAPDGAVVNTRADELDLGLDKCVASYILPQNMVWYRTNAAGCYTYCLVREYVDPSDREDLDVDGRPIDPEGKDKKAEAWRKDYVQYRLWTPEESILFSESGNDIKERIPHKFGRPPILRLVDKRKHRTALVGKSRMQEVCDLMREYYNRDSELIVSDTIQAHALLSGAEDYCKADNTLSIGPGYLLPKKKHSDGDAYEGWEYVSPPKDPAESLRKNKQDLRDAADRAACLMKPAGVTQGSGAGGGSSTVAQSGLSKQMDATTGYTLLKNLAKTFAKAERFIAEFALLVLNGSPPTPEEKELIKIVYPQKFDLQSAGEIVGGLSKIQTAVKASGNTPLLEAAALKSANRQLQPGLEDDDHAAMEQEIDNAVRRQAPLRDAEREGGISDSSDVFGGRGSRTSEEDWSGQSGSTAVSNSNAIVQ
jgi:hypothetical protein